MMLYFLKRSQRGYPIQPYEEYVSNSMRLKTLKGSLQRDRRNIINEEQDLNSLGFRDLIRTIMYW